MHIGNEEVYRRGYAMRSALADVYGIAEKICMSEDEEEKKILLDKIKQCVVQVSEFEESAVSQVSPGDVNNFKMKDTRALVVDDNEISNFVVANILESYGVEVDIALSGKEAIKLFENNVYDIVFMDYIMPDMNGIDTTAGIRKMKNGKEQLIVGITASTVPKFKEGLNSLGVELIIFKPIKQEHIGFILSKELSDKVVIDFTSEI